ncbi:guanyl nucleotide exchange factor [Tribonema minus]|uniref:Guanyl nucleotide exchange factor n=1 Tax=Tribonema minus TaxID=303371 RepID=A0A836CBD3_9STRA|nr:guanyl nucleotide exchange factor [Tribonema minus]
MAKKGRMTMAKSLRLEVESMWRPLMEIEAEDAAKHRADGEAAREKEYFKAEAEYQRWRTAIAAGRGDTTLPPNGIGLSAAPSPNRIDRQLALMGLTERAGGSVTPRGVGAVVAIAAGANHALLLHRTGQLYSWGLGISGRLGLDVSLGGQPQADAPRASPIPTLAARPVTRMSAGFSHSAAVAAGGQLYTWGSGATGKLGIGACEGEAYVAAPARVLLGGSAQRPVKRLSCGAAHTAAVTGEGQLWVWGCTDGGRLGLSPLPPGGAIWVPTLVESLLDERVALVSCGSAHTLVATAVVEEFEGSGESMLLLKIVRGGRVYAAGSASALGELQRAFAPIAALEGLAVRHVSAGHAHSAVITGEGELYTWGSNRGGCCGHPLGTAFVAAPACVAALYQRPQNLARGCTARQSSVFNNCEAERATNGETGGHGAAACTCTQQDAQAWWEVDLGSEARIDTVRVWNRSDEPDDPSFGADLYARRLFPCWVMVSRTPYAEGTGGDALKAALAQSQARVRLTAQRRCSTWRLPDQTSARYVRIQLEGFNFLHLAQVEVLGTKGARRSPGRVCHAVAGRYVTAVVVRALPDPEDVEVAYKRAVQVR